MTRIARRTDATNRQPKSTISCHGDAAGPMTQATFKACATIAAAARPPSKTVGGTRGGVVSFSRKKVDRCGHHVRAAAEFGIIFLSAYWESDALHRPKVAVVCERRSFRIPSGPAVNAPQRKGRIQDGRLTRRFKAVFPLQHRGRSYRTMPSISRAKRVLSTVPSC